MPPAPKLTSNRCQAHAEGNTKPGTRIEVRNLSRGTQDVMVEADAQGTFFDVPRRKSRKGDYPQLHLERPDGQAKRSFAK